MTEFIDVTVQCRVHPEHRFQMRAQAGRVVVAVASAKCRECGRIVKRVDEARSARSRGMGRLVGRQVGVAGGA